MINFARQEILGSSSRTRFFFFFSTDFSPRDFFVAITIQLEFNFLPNEDIRPPFRNRERKPYFKATRWMIKSVKKKKISRDSIMLACHHRLKSILFLSSRWPFNSSELLTFSRSGLFQQDCLMDNEKAHRNSKALTRLGVEIDPLSLRIELLVMRRQ